MTVEHKQGTRYECFNCSTKFYDLGKPDPLCPKCGANQNDAAPSESQVASSAPTQRAGATIDAQEEPGEGESWDDEPGDEEPVDEDSADEEPVDEEPVDEEE